MAVGKQPKKYPSLVELQEIERSIAILLKEYEGARADYMNLITNPEPAHRCPQTNQFPYALNGVAGSACCDNGKLKSSKDRADLLLDTCDGHSVPCTEPPCIGAGSVCPVDWPYPFTLDGVEGGGCCATGPSQGPAVDDGGGSGEGSGASEGDGPDGGGGTGAGAGGSSARPAAASGSKAKPSAGTGPPSLPYYAPEEPPQRAPMLEAFTASPGGGTSTGCEGAYVPCPNPPCTSGRAAGQRREALAKIDRLNRELAAKISEAEQKLTRAYQAGITNTQQTGPNNERLNDLRKRLSEESTKVKEALKGLENAASTSEAQRLNIKMSQLAMAGFAIVMAIVLGLAATGQLGAGGKADAVVLVAALLVAAHQVYQWVGK